jgi:hypothetical protein
MSWFLAKIVYQISCGNGHHQPQFDEQLRLVRAPVAAEAWQRARQLGLEGEDLFANDDAALVRWQFIDVSELHVLEPELDGAELYSQVREADDADSYLNFVHFKASCLREAMLTI